MLRLLSFVCLCAGLLVACGPKSQDSAEEPANTPTNETVATPTGNVLYPKIPVDTLQMLMAECDYIDFVFYQLNFSMNQSEPAAIQTTLRHFDDVAPEINPACQSMGRVFFQVEGVNRAQAELYLGEGCAYYVFLEDNKPKYANRMSQIGFSFYQRIFQQMMNSGQ